jgi:CxxC-x17-CxxC domain-containing protein
MKKIIKKRKPLMPSQPESDVDADLDLDVAVDVAGLISKLQEQMCSLEKKIDILINRPSAQAPERHFEPEHRNDRERHFDRSHHNDRERHDGDFRERNLFKVVCAECGNECQVPFRPNSGRPVYCKECFSKRKGGGSFGRENDSFSGNTESRGSFRPKKAFSFKRKRR